VISPELRERRQRAAALLPDRKLDALVVFSPANIRYLTGFTGSKGLLLLLPDRAALFTDPRYGLQAREQTDCPVHVARGSLLVALARRARTRRVCRLGVEQAYLSYDEYLALDESLPAAVTMAPVAGMIESLRMIKSPAEIQAIRRSVETASEAFRQVLPLIRPGVSELDLAAEVEYRMRQLGAEKPAFETIVAFGRRSALVHASPTAGKLAAGDPVLIDMGAMRDGYASDMTRVVFTRRPTKAFQRLYRDVLEAQLAAIDRVREGVTASSVDEAARRVLRACGLGRWFVHSTGHGLGLEVHEIPRLGKMDRTLLQAGVAVTVEPGVYLQKLGGIRIEDTLVVTRNGCEILTPTSKELLVI